MSLERTNQHLKNFLQGKVRSKTAVGYMWSGVPLVQMDSRILWSSVSVEGIRKHLWQMSFYLCILFISLYLLLKFGRVPISYNFIDL